MNRIKLLTNILNNDLKGWLNREKISEVDFYKLCAGNSLFPISEVVLKISNGEMARKDGLAELKAKCIEICGLIKVKAESDEEARQEKLQETSLKRECSILRLDEFEAQKNNILSTELSPLDKNTKIAESYNKIFN